MRAIPQVLAVLVAAPITLLAASAAEPVSFPGAKWPESCLAPKPSPIAANIPEQYRPFSAFMGWWATANGPEDLCYYVVLTEVAANGDVKAQYSWGNSSQFRIPAGQSIMAGNIKDNVLTIQSATPVVITHRKEGSGWIAEYRRGVSSTFVGRHVVEGKTP